MAFRPQAQWPARLAWVGLVLVLAVPIGWGIHASYGWDVDNIAPGSVLKAMAARFAPGWHSSYGPVPYLLTAAVYAPVLAAMRLAGELGRPSATYPWGFAHPDAAVAVLVVAARLVNLLLALGIAALATRDAVAADSTRSSRGPRARAWLVPLALAGSAVFTYYARTSNVDMVALFWAWLAFALAETRRRTLAPYAGAAVAAALAVCSKEQIAPFAVVAALVACARAWRLPGHARVGSAAANRVRGAGGAAVVVAAGLLAYALVWGLPFNASGWLAHHRFLFETARYPRTFAATLAGYGALGLRTLQLAPLAFGWPVLLGLLAALGTRPSVRGLGARAVAAVLYLLAFIASVGYVYPRFLLPLLIVLLPVAVRGLDTTWQRAAAPLRGALVGMVGLLALAGGPALDQVMLADTRLGVERWLADHVPTDQQVEIAGNPHFQARVPHALRLIVTTADSLRARPRGPRGDVVLLSSLDAAELRREPLRAVYADSLQPGGDYVLGRLLVGPLLGPLFHDLPVAPHIWVYRRVGPPTR